MNKKKFATMTAAVALVGAMGAGATLALLTDSTGTLVNSFSVATGYTGEEQGIRIQETKLGTEDKTDYEEGVFEGNSYENLLPGDTVTKDPNAVLDSESIESYIFMKVEGVDELETYDMDKDGKGDFTVDEFSSNWQKVDATSAGKDGLYVYVVDGDYTFAPVDENGDGAVDDFTTADLFETVTYNLDCTSDAVDENIPKISLTAYAVQAQNVESYTVAAGYVK